MKEEHPSIAGRSYLFWGSLVVLCGLAMGLGAYYLHIEFMREVAFSLISFGVITLFLALQIDLNTEIKSSRLSYVLALFLLVLYFVLRIQLSRFDFGVGDASDYYVAGVCSVTYGQDIGFFLPLTASVSALGYSILGSAYAPWINVILYASSVPLVYFIFRKLDLSLWVSLFMSIFLIINPLSIWFSKTSFSEPIWQMILLIFILFFYRMTGTVSLKIRDIMGLYLLLALVPFLRGESALYYGLVLFLALYHFWKFSSLKSALIIVFGLVVLAVSIHITLGIREHYLLGWQFSRVIPGIATVQLMSLLYGASGLAIVVLLVCKYFKKGFSLLPFPLIITIVALLFKVIIAYIYSERKAPSFLDFLFTHEFGMMLGNFGFPLTLAIIIGLILLHYRAIKGERIALVLVLMYAIFYLPFVMQGVTFHDPHELFLYWSRYYFSVLMIVHIFALALVIQLFYMQIKRFFLSQKYQVGFMGILLLLLILSSLNLKVAEKVITEGYLENSDEIFSWIKKRVGGKPISVVYDTEIRYERHNGVYDAKVFVSRMFMVRKIYAKTWQKMDSKDSTSKVILKNDVFKTKYLILLSSKKERLQNKRLQFLDEKIFPISWREHYRAQPRNKDEVYGDVSKSYMNNLQLYISVYKILR